MKKKNGQILSNFRNKLLPLQDIFYLILKFKVMDIGNNLRTIRTKNNMSQQEVADFVGVDRKTYISWEAGTSDVKGIYIPKLAEFLHVDINDLFKEKSRDIVITQHNTESKDGSINGIIIVLNDKDTMNQLVETIKNRFGNNSEKQ